MSAHRHDKSLGATTSKLYLYKTEVLKNWMCLNFFISSNYNISVLISFKIITMSTLNSAYDVKTVIKKIITHHILCFNVARYKPAYNV